MFNFKINNFQSVFDKFEKITQSVDKFSDFVANPMANFILYEVKKSFDNEQSPDGTKWKPSIRTQLTGGKTLFESGRLKNSIAVQVNGNQIKIGSALKYANIHQYGGTIRAKTKPMLRFKLANGKWICKKEVVIPTRPFLGLPSDASILNFIIKHFKQNHHVDIFTGSN